MKISEIINELTVLQQYIGNKDLEACIANAATTGVNVMYTNDDGSITSTSLDGEKAEAELKATMSDQEVLGEFNVKVLHLDLCDASDDPNLVARADVEVTNDTSFLSINGLNLRYNDTTGEYSIIAPKSPTGVCINDFTCRAVTSAVVARYEQTIGKFPKRDDIEKIGNALEKDSNKMIWHPYKDCGDAPKVAEYQKDVFLCKVQMYHSDNDEPVGTPVYKVLLCDDGGIFYGYSKNDGDYYNKVIAWTEIIG